MTLGFFLCYNIYKEKGDKDTLLQKAPKIDQEALWYIYCYVRWANEDIQKYSEVMPFTKEYIKTYVDAMLDCGINIDRNRIYETNYLYLLACDYIKEN